MLRMEEERSESYLKKREMLIDRVDKNYADNGVSLLAFGKRELIEMADRISETANVYEFMTGKHIFTEKELDFYLRFENPLMVVTDEWTERRIETFSDTLDEMEYANGALLKGDSSLLSRYALFEETKDAGLHRFMDVDIIDFLGQIAGKVVIHYPGDWEIDKERLIKASLSGNIDEKRLVWHACSYGTYLQNERDVYLSDTNANSYITNYRNDEKDMLGYVIELAENKSSDSVVRGNVFEVGDYAEYAKHISETALPFKYVSIEYEEGYGKSAGKSVYISRSAFDRDRSELMGESGKISEIRYWPELESELAQIFTVERAKRMAFPVGDPKEQIAKVIDKIELVRKRTIK